MSRTGFYRHLDEHAPRQAETELRGKLHRICLDHRSYGSRRVTAELRAQGHLVNRKRVVRLMQADNLLLLTQAPFCLAATDSRHTYSIYPNLTTDWKPDRINQLWVADITYIRLSESFLYLAVILDAYSRRVIGWALDDALEAKLAIKALHRALALSVIRLTSLVHHSDRGVQYCSGEYVEILHSHGVKISMGLQEILTTMRSRNDLCALSNVKST